MNEYLIELTNKSETKITPQSNRMSYLNDKGPANKRLLPLIVK
jgi:hypothetical protein